MRRPWHRQRDRYATPRCVRVKTSGKGVQPFLLAIAGSRRRQRGKGWSLNRSQPTRASERPSFPHFLHTVSLSIFASIPRPCSPQGSAAESHTTNPI